MTGSTVRVFLVDDHEVERRGLADLLSEEPGIEVIGEAATARGAMARVPVLMPDVVLLDVQLPDGDGVHVCRDLKQQAPEVACLIVTTFDDDRALFDAVLAGASGYVVNRIGGPELVDAIRVVAAGGSTLDPHAADRVMERLRRDASPPDDPLANLTPVERRVLTLVGRGLTNGEIAGELLLTEQTIKNNVSSILTKLRLERRVQAAVLAARLGIC
ncbi:response regulator [Myceligenerans indicum]|uniref:Response regulator transcription factor n=1 Tax=Myceligenerans indicum TaxID=2593663 RepID=A0ABS1LNU6_9MICO|nr:response regulator transcription factor [Myceligenerans indicum]MBL0887764.1 response regulator transcription factor [Myceligenerans indicum]